MKLQLEELYQFIIDEKLESDFLNAIMFCIDDYTITEIGHGEFQTRENRFYYTSKEFKIDVEITEDDIITAILNHLYISAFLSKTGNQYQLHFMVHPYPASMKNRFEEEIAQEVIRYYIMMTLHHFSFDTKGKVRSYIEKGKNMGL